MRSLLLLLVPGLMACSGRAADWTPCPKDFWGANGTPCAGAEECFYGGCAPPGNSCRCEDGEWSCMHTDCFPPDLGLDLGADIGFDLGQDAGSPDDSSGVDGSYPPLFKDLEGIWLVGWGGGMNHYSWVRLTVTSSFGGTAIILDGATLTANLPFWSCSGATTWNLASKPDTIQLHFPSPTCTTQGLKSASYTFSNIAPAGSYPKGATHTAQVTTSQPPAALEGYRFVATQCNAAMTSCTDPFL